jgi:hypothetical protein
MDFIKAGDLVFLSWIVAFLAYLGINAVRFSIATTVTGVLETLTANFQEKMAVIGAGNPGHADFVAKDAARALVEKEVRAVIRTSIRRNDAVTDEDLANMKLPIWKTGKSRIAQPTKRPSWKALHKQYGELEIVANAKPAGVTRLEIWYANVKDWDMNEKDYTKMSHMVESSTIHTILKLTQGETYFIVLRWAAERSKTAKGPWSSPKAETIS